MKSLDTFTLKKLIWQNFDNDSFPQLCKELGIDEQKLPNKGVIEKTNYLVDQTIKDGQARGLFEALNKLKPDILVGKFFFDENFFLPQEVLLKDPSLISVPLDETAERIIQPHVDDPKANVLLKNIGELYARLERLADPDSQDKLFTKLEEASQIIRSKWGKDDYWKQLAKAEFLIGTTSADIYRLEKQRELRITIEEENSRADKRIHQDELTLTIVIPLIILFYASLVVAAAIVTTQQGSGDFVLPLLSIPFSVLIWAAIGSLSAIMYRYYKRMKKSSLIPELRLTFGRFWIGLVSGAIFYFAMRSGLFILSNQVVDLNTSPLGQQQLIWVLVWLTSFSDFTFERIITRLSGNVVGEESAETVSSIFKVNISDISEAIERSYLRPEFRRLRAEVKADIDNKIKNTIEPIVGQQANIDIPESKPTTENVEVP